MLAGLSVPVPGSAATVTTRPSLAPFSALKLDGAFTLDFRAGARQSVSLSGNRYVIDNLMVAVDHGVLDIVRPHGFDLPRNKTITLTITAPSLRRVDLRGLVHADIAGLAGPSFTLDNNGAAAVTVSGQVDRFSVVSRGVASIDSGGLHAHDLTALVRGQANLRVFASRSATVTMYGEGRVDVLGHPPVHQFKSLAYGIVSLQ